MVFDSLQQKNELLGILEMVQVNAPVNIARQQIIRIDDMAQAIIAGTVKPPEAVKPPQPQPTKEAK